MIFLVLCPECSLLVVNKVGAIICGPNQNDPDSLIPSQEDLEALLDEGVFDMKRLLELGWVDGLKYEDDLIDLMKERTYPKKKDEYALVGYRRYIKVSPSAFGLNRGKQTIAVMRTVGGIGSVLSEDRGSGGGIAAKSVVNKLRALEKNKAVKAIVLFVNSPGGDALASDVM